MCELDKIQINVLPENLHLTAVIHIPQKVCFLFYLLSWLLYSSL